MLRDFLLYALLEAFSIGLSSCPIRSSFYCLYENIALNISTDMFTLNISSVEHVFLQCTVLEILAKIRIKVDIFHNYEAPTQGEEAKTFSKLFSISSRSRLQKIVELLISSTTACKYGLIRLY